MLDHFSVGVKSLEYPISVSECDARSDRYRSTSNKDLKWVFLHPQ